MPTSILSQTVIYLFIRELLRPQSSTIIIMASLSQSRSIHMNSRVRIYATHVGHTDYRALALHLSRKQHLERVSCQFCPTWMLYVYLNVYFHIILLL